jgi:NADPH:quinone reductase-like Zn-dependent oxidoreductase
LINGGGGGVGNFGVQIAKLHGLEVTGVDHGSKLEIMQSWGFDHLIDYTKQDFTKNNELYDLILDVKTNRPIFHYLRVLKNDGKYITVGGSLSRLFRTLLVLPVISLFNTKKVIIVVLKPNKDLAYVNSIFEQGKLKPAIDGYYGLADVPEAFKLFSRAGHKGKIVISINTP